MMNDLSIRTPKTAILINTRDRPTELAMLLQSLKTQIEDNFDIFILDDCGGTPLTNYNFFNCIISRLKIEGHKIFLKRTEFPNGVSRARQNIVDWALESDYKYFLRIDDDVTLEDDFLERLIYIIDEDWDIATGVTPPMMSPTVKRNSNFISGGIVNRVILDKDGKFIHNGDDCGMTYLSTEHIFPAHHFRSSALMTREVMEQIKYYPTKLTKHGFREEEIFSFKALMKGFKIGVDLNAIAWHQLTPSGGERFAESQQLMKQNAQTLHDFTKENKNKLRSIFIDETIGKLELKKETNLI